MTDRTTRESIVEAADQLFYRRGFEHTSFSDIASVVNISRGNFYHHFRTKDEILKAVIESRLQATRHLLSKWEQEFECPEHRILRYIDILLVNKDPIKRYGCPVGMLCSELARLKHVERAEANAVFTLFRDWLRTQFVQLGYGREADSLALHVIARSQGIAVMANAFGDEEFITYEVKLLHDWLRRYVEGATRGAARAGPSSGGWSRRGAQRDRSAAGRSARRVG